MLESKKRLGIVICFVTIFTSINLTNCKSEINNKTQGASVPGQSNETPAIDKDIPVSEVKFSINAPSTATVGAVVNLTWESVAGAEIFEIRIKKDGDCDDASLLAGEQIEIRLHETGPEPTFPQGSRAPVFAVCVLRVQKAQPSEQPRAAFLATWRQ